MYEDDLDPFPPPEQYQIPSDPKKIKERIRRYERALKKEKEQYGAYRDGSGKRFLLGPFYMIIGDLDGAMQSFAWFEASFPGGLIESPQLLCWSLALLRSGEEHDAREMLRRTMFANLYIIPRLLGMEVQCHDIWHGSNKAAPSYLSWIPDEYWGLWDERELEWARELWEGDEFRETREQYIEMRHKLKSLRPGPERSSVVDDMQKLRDG